MTKNNSGPGNKKKIEKKPLPSTHPHSFKSFLTTTPKPSSPLTRQTGKAKARINKVHMFPIQIGDIVIVAAYSWYIHTKLQVEASPPQASCLATWAQDEKNQKDVQNLHLLGSYVRLATDGGPMASNPQYQNRADCLFPFISTCYERTKISFFHIIQYYKLSRTQHESRLSIRNGSLVFLPTIITQNLRFQMLQH